MVTIEGLLIVFGICGIVNGIWTMWKDKTVKETIERFSISFGMTGIVYGIICSL